MKCFSVWVFDPLFKSFVSSEPDQYSNLDLAVRAAQNVINDGYFKRVNVCRNNADGSHEIISRYSWRNRSK